MKKLALYVLSFIFLLCVTVGFVGCTTHEHSFTEQVTTNDYLAAAATCTEAARYYYSCTCGEKGTQTFASGNALGHSFTNYVSDNNATCTADGTKTAKCDRDGCNATDTIADEGSKLPHTFDKQVATEQYLASAATCTEAARYYYSCTCGEKGTQTFASGNALGHSYSDDWSHNQTEHWHAATCGHDVEKDRAAHTFDENKKCTECGYITTKPLGLELQSSVFDINLATKTVYLKVANAVTDYDFSDKFVVSDGARFDVCTDKQCNNKIASKRTDLIAGDNVFYILVTNGNNVASYTLTLRRRPIYTVTFNTNGGTAVETQQVEEDSFATAPTTTRKGYEFTAWDYDFSSPVLQEEVVTASWQIIAYNITYDLNVPADSISQVVDNSFNPTTYTVEDEITFAALNRVGYTFTGWDKGIAKGTTETQTITASWQIIAYNITYDLNVPADSASKDVDNSFNPTTYTVENEITFASLSRAGYAFTGWDKGITKGTTETQTITASWQIIVYNISYQLNGGEVFGRNPTIYTVEEEKAVPSLPFMTGYTGTWNNDGKIEKGTIGDITFFAVYTPHVKLSDDGSTIVGLRDTSVKNLVILSQYNGKQVTKIADNAFYGCKGLTSITIPDSVTSIGDYAFYICRGLTSVTIPDSVISIGDWAFVGCSKLENIYITDIAAWCKISGIGNLMGYGLSNKKLYLNNELLTDLVIPDGVKSIGSGAFQYCRGLTSITIPDSVTWIGDSAFSGCYKLVEVINNSSLSITKGSSSNGYVAYHALNVKKGGSSDIVNQDGYLFYTYDSVNYLFGYVGTETGLTLPNNYNGQNYQINKYAFCNCSGLTSVTIPNSVTSIGSSAFFGCSGLTSVIIPSSVTSIGDRAFYGCSGLTSITIPNSVTSIGSGAFQHCRGLTSITIPDSVTSIGSSAFFGCYKLVEVINNSSLSITKGRPSNGCVAYYALNVKKVRSSDIVNKDGYLFYTYNSVVNYLLGYVGTETELTLPNNYNGQIYQIYKYAFYDCSKLKSMTIPDSVTSIGESAFQYCSGLTSINYNGTKEQWLAISKGSWWNEDTGNYTIHCTDGDFAK